MKNAFASPGGDFFVQLFPVRVLIVKKQLIRNILLIKQEF